MLITSFYKSRRKFYSGTLLVLLLLLLSQSFLFAQVGVVRGTVMDKNTEEPLVGANIIVKGTSIGAATDLEGKFIIRNIPVGSQTLTISYIGYNSVSIDVNIIENRSFEENFYLEYKTIEGETVTITAQAEGQLGAINQQFNSNTIANVVARDRIKELPDVNAAETIGRLPGVSIERSGGEANKISIRGLEPKYNSVTVNGVRLPATGSDDRSIDLSLIASNMLDGITLKKANTPDMDADALGGTVDLRLKEAPVGLQFSASVQGGYNQLQDYYGNYALTGSVSNRFLDNSLGVIANLNLDDYNRSADKFQGDYNQTGVAPDIVVKPTNIRLRAENVTRRRTGASILLDYRIPSGKVIANSFYNRLNNESINRINVMNVAENRHQYTLENKDDVTSIFTGTVGIEQDFNWIKYDFTVARTSSLTDNPGNYEWNFIQENVAFNTGGVYAGMDPHEIPALQTIDTLTTGLRNVFIHSTTRKENESSFQFNTQLPFMIGSDIKGYVKLGGKFRWLDRLNDQEKWGLDNLQYGGSAYQNASIVAALKYLAEHYPDDWNWESDSALARNYAAFPVSRFLLNEPSPHFLNGEYNLGFMINERILRQFTDAFKSNADQYPNNWLSYSTGTGYGDYGSDGGDYDGIERYQAAYIMSELSWNFFTLIPGVRYERDYSEYNGQRFRGAGRAASVTPPDYTKLKNVRENEFWLPIVHLIVSPADWLKIRLARTETLTRPDYIQYAPITSIDIYGNYIRANNALLKPARSVNLDASVQIYENYTGFFTISGFHKRIENLIFQVGYQLRAGVPTLEGSNIPDDWRTNNPYMDTYVNNPNPAYYKGFELDWQTRFWYLPSVLQGLVLNVNYTRIFSEIDKQIYSTQRVITGIRPRSSYIVTDTIRTSRMPYQPAHILNVTFGYDFKDFSLRLSYLYQSDKTAWIANDAALDQSTGTYYRWDLTLQQKLDWGLQVYANLTNLNKRADRNYRGNVETNASYTEYYGFTMDLGIRYNLQ